MSHKYSTQPRCLTHNNHRQLTITTLTGEHPDKTHLNVCKRNQDVRFFITDINPIILSSIYFEQLRADSHMPYRSHGVPLQRGRLIHTYYAVPMPLTCHSPTVPKAGRTPTCRLWTADAYSHILCRSHAVPLPRPYRGFERSLSERHFCGMTKKRHGMCKSNTAALCKSSGKGTIYTLSGTTWYV
jgi:hypothetical protein